MTEIEIKKETETVQAPGASETAPETPVMHETPPLSDEKKSVEDIPKKRKRKYTRHKREPSSSANEAPQGNTVEPESEIVVEGAELNRKSTDEVVPSFEKETSTESIAKEAVPDESTGMDDESEPQKDYGIYIILFAIGMVALIYYLYTQYSRQSVMVSRESNAEQDYQIILSGE